MPDPATGYAQLIGSMIPPPIAVSVQLAPAPVPHWTAYATAVATPLVAVMAAVLAGVIAYRNWRTAQNKLKLDLFERRSSLFQLFEDMRIDVARGAEWDILSMEESRYTAFRHAVRQATWLFDRKVNAWLESFADDVRDYFVHCMPLFSKDPPTEEIAKRSAAIRLRIRGRMSENAQAMREVFADALTIRH